MKDVTGAKQTPSSDGFVVKPKPGADAETKARLSGLGEVEEIPGSNRLVLRLPEPAADTKGTWRRLVEVTESVEWAAPFVVDETGGVHLPTGDVSIRFRHPPSEKQLARFARVHRLRIRERNEFVPEQVTAEPIAGREIYLPELIEEISAERIVLTVWADTLSPFRR